MISGRVIPVADDGPGLEARVDVGIAGSNSIFQTVAVVVDTGFSGELALPPELIRSLGLEYIDDVSVALADRQARPVRAYEGVVSWQGRSRDVTVLDMGSEPLLGMALLLGSRLTVSCRSNGPVIIQAEA